MLQIVKDRAETTLAAGPTELLGVQGISVKGYTRLSFILVNIGSSPVTGIAVYWMDSETFVSGAGDWSPADVGVIIPTDGGYNGTIVPGQSIEYTITDLSRSLMRLAVIGTAGQKVRLTLSATWV